ncbi:MAG TPA: PEP-CTERM sorting domain-containing protein [Candidatus Acidoferrales bacterium]|nr:PEP-CTERM sorting domain-containing protein [Candidatus Acidoferrales bacterium]
MVRTFCLFLASMFVALFAGAGPAAAGTRLGLAASPFGSFTPPATRAGICPAGEIASVALAATFLTGRSDQNDDRDGGKGWDQDGGRSSRDTYRDGDRGGDRDGDRDHDRDRDRHRRGNDHDHDGDDHAPKPIPEPSTLLSFAVAVLVGGGVLVSRRLLGSRK